MAQSVDILCANLEALRRTDPHLADWISRTTPADLDFFPSKAGSLTATVRHDNRTLALSSRYAPQQETQNLVGTIDHTKTACVILLGLGLGYHAMRVARGQGQRGLLVIYAPDLSFLRAVFE